VKDEISMGSRQNTQATEGAIGAAVAVMTASR
jgi:hypothetical protein